MNVHIDWQQKYLLGIEQIDEQHHYFAGLINRLSDEMSRSDDAQYKLGLYAELAAYAKFHFVSEENLMFKAGYPDLAQHHKHHLQLIDTLSSKLGMVQVDKTQERIDDMLAFLRDWFLTHTVVEDRRFADYENQVRGRRDVT